jgi:excisionase family DNA binding protein
VVSVRFVSQQEAADLAGCSKDTIIRARRAGRFPHARLRGHTWTIPTDDLDASGLLSPADPPTGPAVPALGRGETAALVQVEVELAQALARVAGLEEVVTRQDDELRFLRQLTVDSFGKRGAA